MRLTRRVLLLAALMFWQGGFAFYGAVVVPVGAEVLGSHRDQGFVTRRVTVYLNGAGVVVLAVWACELTALRRTTVSLKRLRWPAWLPLVAILAVQFWLHGLIDAHLDPNELTIRDYERFREMHRLYLIVSTVQWALALLLLGWTVFAWGRHDGDANEPRS